ncbi:hypothetical protein IWQ57_003925, partial [Coemansia nantahalensis]
TNSDVPAVRRRPGRRAAGSVDRALVPVRGGRGGRSRLRVRGRAHADVAHGAVAVHQRDARGRGAGGAAGVPADPRAVPRADPAARAPGGRAGAARGAAHPRRVADAGRLGGARHRLAGAQCVCAARRQDLCVQRPAARGDDRGRAGDGARPRDSPPARAPHGREAVAGAAPERGLPARRAVCRHERRPARPLRDQPARGAAQQPPLRGGGGPDRAGPYGPRLLRPRAGRRPLAEHEGRRGPGAARAPQHPSFDCVAYHKHPQSGPRRRAGPRGCRMPRAVAAARVCALWVRQRPAGALRL